jgi:hypothetical protein
MGCSQGIHHDIKRSQFVLQGCSHPHAHEIPGENVELWVAMVDAILQRLGGVDAAEHLNRLQQDMERMDDEQE